MLEEAGQATSDDENVEVIVEHEPSSTEALWGDTQEPSSAFRRLRCHRLEGRAASGYAVLIIALLALSSINVSIRADIYIAHHLRVLWQYLRSKPTSQCLEPHQSLRPLLGDVAA